MDLSPVDFCGEMVSSFAETLYTLVFEDPKLSAIATIVTGIKAKKQVVILGILDLVGRKKTTTQCAPLDSEEQIDSVEKFWDPEHIEDRFVECWKNLLEKFTVWGLKSGIQKPDLTGTDFANFLEDQILDGLRRSVLRIAWFSDKDAESFTDGGHVKDGLNLDYFNPIDGFWKQFYAIVAANPAQRVTISENAGANFAAQAFDAADITARKVTGIFQQMYAKADERLLGSSDVAFYVTRSMAEQYRLERTDFANIEISYKRTEEGWDYLEYNGIPIIVLAFQDRMIKQYFSSATVAYQPHRAYLATKSEMQIGVEEERNLSEIETFYDQREKEYVADILYTLDAMAVRDEMFVFAY